MLFRAVLVILLISLKSSKNIVIAQHVPNNKISFNTVQGWGVKLGTELYHFGEFITRKKEVEDSWKSAQIESRDGEKLVQSMADDIRAMMELKISAVKRIVEAAENMAFDKQNEPIPDDYQFYNSKEMEDLLDDTITTTPEPEFNMENWIIRPPSKNARLEQNAHFSNIPVNINITSVHVPTNVYAWAPEVIKGVHWSEGLDTHFINNYQSDPTLSWQYFGSSTGFMRHYPAMKWKADPVDIYDCRTRAWYMEAAASPKDVVILVDRSGSMTGQRRDIAKHVVTNILDTLGNNDFVNVMTFANTVEEIVPCFEDSLVQATLGNIREFKLALDNFDTMEIANFSAALTRAFDLLEIYRNNSGGANCNQAIMLVTDGVPYNYKELFERYNWKYDTPVRVFTYLIGREVKVADVREVKWMACANKGYYVHLSTLAEVRERVLEHVNVLARPLVLQREKHPVVWTPVYANITDPKVADYLWEQRERAEQKERFMSQRRDKVLFNSEKEQNRRWKITQMKQGQYSELGNAQYQLMTSVSMPVYDLRHNENITENVLINEAYWVSVTKESVEENGQKEMRIARLLGVAGTDVPLSEIQALMTPYKVGVNGYAFMVTNNGYILIHPDLRPVFQQILKPSYNSVDMIEVELFDDDRSPRNFSKELTALRQDVIDQKTGNKIMSVKYHMDDMKRVSRGKKHYFWTGISESPFTLVLAIPENYGRHRITPPPTDDIHRLSLTSKNISAKQYLSDKWSVHPDWLYCRHYERTFSTPEEELLYFLERVAKPGWRWPAKPRPPEHHKNKPNHDKHNGSVEGRDRNKSPTSMPRNEYYCDHGLMQALVYDARNTAWFNKSISDSATDEKAPLTKVIGLLPRTEFIQRFGYIVAFLATHSGLTRWQTHPLKERDDKPEFGKFWPRAIDEVWYRRAIEQHYIDPLSYVYSVEMSTDKFPLNVTSAVVTASHAVFHSDGHRKAPAAVVGFQFRHERLSEWFENITSSCEHKECVTCASDDWECYLVDSNGWIIVSKDITQTGHFFGKVRPDIMLKLVEDEVYKAVHVVDYQAVCFREKKTTNPGSVITTPLENLRMIMSWLIATTVWFYNTVSVTLAQSSYSFDDVAYQNYENDEETDDPSMFKPPMRIHERDFEKLVLINRTRPTPCDREMYLYQMDCKNLDEKLNKPLNECTRPFYAQLVNYTNMLLIVVDAMCPKKDVSMPSIDPTEVQYNESLPCLKHKHPLYRKQPASCIRNHTEESNIDMCGRGSLPHKTLLPWILVVLKWSISYILCVTWIY
ncbi:voltage-dependent calcium channel subunit alpha-2/delta-3 isoform X3 [Leptidea sinapis]|uniref:voltage-dependent calcium channel subunit alpha-2/delta-3 isoform X3 n=1 Tax=Leptidea sinapis TaxID=189913 RepID=UPI0021C2CEDB|nr:voltage-dependent calcium channel subunit alpha-2/delta-3 isoform X3 [Leptidea sinapis]